MTPTDEFGGGRLYRGDASQALAAMSDESVDLVLTDPPYPMEFWPAVRAVVPHMARVLRNGGELVMLTGQHMMPHALDWLRETGLRYWWTCAMKHHTKARMLGKYVTICWKPALWFVKGTKRRLDDMPMDMLGGNRPDKKAHEWEQGVEWFRHWCDRGCNSGETVLDPFMGSGTTGVGCLLTGRKFIGCELDPTHYATALKRLRHADGAGSLFDPKQLTLTDG